MIQPLAGPPSASFARIHQAPAGSTCCPLQSSLCCLVLTPHILPLDHNHDSQEEETAAASRAEVLTRAAKRHDAAKLFTDKAEARLHELQAAASRLDLGPGGAGTGAALRVLSAEVAERRTQVQALLLTRNALGARLTDMRRRHERAIARFCERW